MDLVNNNNSLRYKQCAGKHCKKIGINRLGILFINKIGYFCDSCTKQLVELGVVTKEEK